MRLYLAFKHWKPPLPPIHPDHLLLAWILMFLDSTTPMLLPRYSRSINFFEYHHTPEDERLWVASFCCTKLVSVDVSQWSVAFLQALELCFTPSLHDDPRGALFNLSQHGSVNLYLAEFEALANRIVGLSTPFLLSCFISGLSPNICCEVLALQPLSLVQAVALAQL